MPSGSLLLKLVWVLALAVPVAIPTGADAAPQPPTAAHITVETPSTNPGAVIRLGGSGFHPSHSLYVELSGFGVLKATNADGSGNFRNLYVSLPSRIASATYRLRVVQPVVNQDGDATRSAEYYLWVAPFSPQAQPSPYYVPVEAFPGQRRPVHIEASGFGRGEEVVTTIDGVQTVSSSGLDLVAGSTFSTQGRAGGDFAVPRSASGKTVLVSLVGRRTNATARFWITVGPAARPAPGNPSGLTALSRSGPSELHPGESFTVSYSGHLPEEAFRYLELSYFGPGGPIRTVTEQNIAEAGSVQVVIPNEWPAGPYSIDYVEYGYSIPHTHYSGAWRYSPIDQLEIFLGESVFHSAHWFDLAPFELTVIPAR